jgi:hypothetical protein
MIYEKKRRKFHWAMESGKTPAQIAEEHGIEEVDVVHTLRHPKPKIAGASYSHLKIPVPMEEIIEAYHQDNLDVLGELYGLTKATLYQRLPKELRTKKRSRKSKPKATEVLTLDEKKVIVGRYFRSGRILNACGVSSQVAKEVLIEMNVPLKEHGTGDKSIPAKDMVTMLDYLLEKTALEEITPQDMFMWSRKLYEFKTPNPHVWKGQILDWLLEGSVDRDLVPFINEAIEQVLLLRGYEDADS